MVRSKVKKTEPLQFEKRYILDAVEIISKRKPKIAKVREHADFEKAVLQCNKPKVEKFRSWHNTYLTFPTTRILLYELRKSILRHDWRYCTELVNMLLLNNQMSKRLLAHVIRTTFLVLYNHKNRNPNVVSEFLTMCLGIRSDKVDDFVVSTLLLPDQLEIFCDKYNSNKYFHSKSKSHNPEED